jgi:hypothetical protein
VTRSGRRSLWLVGGSTSLAELPEAAAWAREQLASRLGGAAGTVLLAGDDEPPASWARELAAATSVRWVLFRASGERASSWQQTRRWSPTPTHPLERNRALVGAALRAIDAGWHVRCLSLLAPWTLSLAWDSHLDWCARRAGVEVERLAHQGLIEGLSLG